MSMTPLRVVTARPPPLGLYIRVGRNDHVPLQTFLAPGMRGVSGVVIDATLVDRHADLMHNASDRQIDTILDPRTQPLTTIGGYSRALGELPWGLKRIHKLDDFENPSSLKRIVQQIAEFAGRHGF